jgi:L-ascorbate metabolism protein UlaG (beta-lactamase superfamily)
MTLGLKRLVEVALPLSELIPIDLILLSHAHMDHFDTPSLRSLENTGTTIVTATRTADLLRGRRWKAVHQLGWGQSARVKDATVTAFEVAHWGARMRSDLYRGYNGYVVETDRHRIIFGGDTAMTDTFRETRSSRRTDLALMPIGAYDPWIRVHCNPEQAMLMAEQAGAEHILPVHHKTFQLSREPYTEPIERLLSAAGASPERVAVRDIGQEFHLTI